MSVFEKVVRPAQLGDISPTPLPNSGTSGGDSAGNTTTLELGKGTSVKLMFGSQTIDQTYYAIKKPREQKKQQQ
jgi:hypothetical protein